MTATLLEGGWTRVAIGFGVAAVAAQVATSIGDLGTLSGATGLLGALVVWSWGMVLTIHPIAEQLHELRETITATDAVEESHD